MFFVKTLSGNAFPFDNCVCEKTVSTNMAGIETNYKVTSWDDCICVRIGHTPKQTVTKW